MNFDKDMTFNEEFEKLKTETYKEGRMRKLYEISDDIIKCVDLETGEIVDADKLNALRMEYDQKVESVILWRKDVLAEYEAVKAEYQSLQKRAKSLENLAESLKGYIKNALDGAKFKTARCSVSYRRSESVEIDNFLKVPTKFYKAPKEDWINKTALKDALLNGEEVPGGVHIVEKRNIIIK